MFQLRQIRLKITSGLSIHVEFTIPAGSYRSRGDVNTAVMAMLVVRADMEEDLVYNIINHFENLETIGNAHEKGKEISVDR